MVNSNIEYCISKDSKEVCSENNNFGYSLICTACNKVIEELFTYHNVPDQSDLY